MSYSTAQEQDPYNPAYSLTLVPGLRRGQMPGFDYGVRPLRHDHN